MTIALKKPIVYVARDIERALGIEPGLHGEAAYFVVSNDSKHGRGIRARYPEHVLLIEGEVRDTYDLLALPAVQAFIRERGADVVVFQSTGRIERLAREQGWTLLNPAAETARRVEEKVSQVEWLGDDAALLPPHQIKALRDARFEGERFVLQFNHAHTGQGTYVIDSAERLASLAAKFPDRPARVTRFVEGPVFTVNAVVPQADSDAIVVGNPSYQITGLPPFTDLPFSTVGNDWSLARRDKYEAVYEDVRRMALAIGERLREDDWRGLFGIDAVYDHKAGKTYLLEINARQPASAVFESTLQRLQAPDAATIFEAHLCALSPSASLAAESWQLKASFPLRGGAQIVKRVTAQASQPDAQALAALRERVLAVIEYDNAGVNKELYRIQAAEGILEAHGSPARLSELGTFIASCFRPTD
ncbi:MAG TPA: hypothetical protein VFQ72_04065 [Candidatus Paceibacterota bacterium]|nr:hypothetical protein [Candidatus Paceibacterota bacterium]